jgi:uncharacterized damage-inducible protein DinB
VDLIERLLGHGRWFTKKFLEAALPLSDEELDREFDIGHRTYRKTAVHLVNVIEGETARLRGVPPAERLPEDASIPETIEAHKVAYDRFEEATRAIVAAGDDKQNATYIDNYGIPQSYGGTVLFVITQNVVRISELRHFLVRLGVEDLLEGDVQEWEHFSGLIDTWGGQYPEGLVKPWAS